MNEQHTPGPWTMEPRNYSIADTGDYDGCYEVRGANKERVVELWGDEDEANARLIAAAPELFRIVEGVVGMLGACNVESGVCCCGDSMTNHADPMISGHSATDSGAYYAKSLYDDAIAAMAKATGGGV